MIYYVSNSKKISGDGSRQYPFKTIQEAANIALPGDEVLVAPGIYREWVNPIHSGSSSHPIIYQSEKLNEAVITGAEEIKNWEQFQSSTWMVEIPNNFFGTYNPYTTEIFGDWYNSERHLHTGEVYLNQQAMYEADNLEQVLNQKADGLLSSYKWYSEQKVHSTVIYANFQAFNPNAHCVEINVRRTCFQPQKTGVNHIHLKGFIIKQAAPNWAPPTAFQDGAVNPHWSKGWVIEDCEITHSRCVGISLGKYLQPNNDNKWSIKRIKHGTQTERDAICQAQLDGWSKETIGSHIVRRCHIHHCGQAGIVGHLGCVFSIIEDNHIHDINDKLELEGAEIAGIKLHAPIDVIIRRNHIHHCTRGLWLDWQAQGTRITKNLLHNNHDPKGYPLFNGEDLFIEVSHGPTLVDHNFFFSAQACRISTQGVAFVHNLINGSFTSVGEGTDNIGSAEILNPKAEEKGIATPRYTPYHVPHGTGIVGFMTFLHGDMRFYNNIFIQNSNAEHLKQKYTSQIGKEQAKRLNLDAGLFPYNGYPTRDEYYAKFNIPGDWGKRESRDKYYEPLPIWTGGNIYFNGAKPFDKEENGFVDKKNDIHFDFKSVDGSYVVESNIDQYLDQVQTSLIDTVILEEAFEPEQLFENPDGSPICFDEDYFGNKRKFKPTVGPIEHLDDWKNKLK